MESENFMIIQNHILIRVFGWMIKNMEKEKKLKMDLNTLWNTKMIS